MTKKQLALEIIKRLKEAYPDAGCTLDYDEAWKLLVSVRLAAQCTDARVNVIVEKLYEKFPDVDALAAAGVSEIEEIVRPCGLGKSKAKDISACMKMLKEQYGGKVPDDFDALLKLPGVGRKSANLIMGDVFGKPAIVTDTHCIRLVNRMGLVKDIKEPKKVEMELWKIIPPEEGNDFCHRLVELDRRYLRSRIEKLESRLKELEKRRGETRRARQKNGVPVISLVGYTNVGKSSLTNALCGAEIFEADMLFATLDPTARKCTLPSGLQVILVDTVGFVSRLPHDLVDAFKSTLEEAACSDIILKIADASDSEAAEQLSVTDEVLNDLGCGDIPQVTVYNKCDRTGVAPYDPDVLLVSAKTGYGLDSLLAKIDEILAHRVRTIEVLLPYDKLALADVFRTRGSVLAEEYRENGVYYKATVKVDDLHRFEAYLL